MATDGGVAHHLGIPSLNQLESPPYARRAPKVATADAKARAAKATIKGVRIVHRHHFASSLQRMSTVVDVAGARGGRSGRACLVKGSPEALKPLLRDGAAPPWYERTRRAAAVCAVCRGLAVVVEPPRS